MVMSTKNVYVVSGTAFTNIPSTSGQDEFIASEMIPTTSWSSKYIVPPAFPKSAFMLRIQSRDEILRVNVENRTHTYSYKPSLSKLYFGNEPVTVIANDSFSVTQYGVGYDFDNINGDPLMAVVPGVDQYLNDYKFSVPVGYYDVKSYVAIIIPRLHQTGLTLDGVSMNAYHNGPRKTFNVPYPFDSYVINVFEIKAGYHHFAHSLQWIKFGVFVYGLGRHIYLGILYGLGYGFYPGYDLTGTQRKL
ncbi:uncharacterized protein LOC132742677 [Ruditapes philippinarum]|uniref:uncharacterized protein LOC132742677 n=1 Tax=Ruditapes philippinarum TaxID=129788 RepID=UPI00295BD646|nr:uncharacterized protein LOC132742677 [Ruditapes philippinarum]